MKNTTMVLVVALTVAFAFVFLAVFAVLVLRCCREAAAPTSWFMFWSLCFQNQKQSRVKPSSDKKRPRLALEHYSGEAKEAGEECELERWKKLFGGPARVLSTIEEGTESGTTPLNTPAFCSPAASPDRRDRALEK